MAGRVLRYNVFIACIVVMHCGSTQERSKCATVDGRELSKALGGDLPPPSGTQPATPEAIETILPETGSPDGKRSPRSCKAFFRDCGRSAQQTKRAQTERNRRWNMLSAGDKKSIEDWAVKMLEQRMQQGVITDQSDGLPTNKRIEAYRIAERNLENAKQQQENCTYWAKEFKASKMNSSTDFCNSLLDKFQEEPMLDLLPVGHGSSCDEPNR